MRTADPRWRWLLVIGACLAVLACAQPEPIISKEEAKHLRDLAQRVEMTDPVAAGALRKIAEHAERPPAPGFPWETILLAIASAAGIAVPVARRYVARMEAQPSRSGLTPEQARELLRRAEVA